MDWEKIKRFFIMLLLALNGGLFAANHFQGSQYHMTAEEEAAIFQLLSDNHIGIYTDLIYDTPPMRSIGASTVSLDTSVLSSIFFSPEEQVKITLEFDKTVLASDTKSLIVEGNTVQYLNPNGDGPMENYNRETALEAADAFLEKINIYNQPNLEAEKVEQVGDNFVIEYNQRFKDYKIFSNAKTITVSPQGVILATASYYQVENYVDESLPICSCDEALLTFLQKMKEEGVEENVYIEKIELGYRLQEDGRVEDGASLRFIPCYRIITATGGKTYFINAYTNEMMP